MKREFNQQVADRFHEMADLLHEQGANAFRVNAYRRAADTIAVLQTDVRELVATGGAESLQRLPTIGTGIAAAIVEIVNTGRWLRLERLMGQLDPVHAFQTVPTIGPALAERIHSVLQVDTLEELYRSGERGELQKVPGIGSRREAAIRAALGARVGATAKTSPHPHPPVPMLLEIDEVYRKGAGEGRFRRIVPARFNPSGEAWLPVMHEQRESWHFTVLYSNTARAHELNRTRDWVVIYYYDGEHREGQCTVVTEFRGPLAGMRVVRGYESECAEYYEKNEKPAIDSRPSSRRRSEDSAGEA